MRQTQDEITQNLAERMCWEVARRDDARVARRLYRKQVVDGVYRLDAGALLDDFFHFLENVGVMALLADVDGTAIHREMVPCVQYVLLYGLKTLFGLERINALGIGPQGLGGSTTCLGVFIEEMPCHIASMPMAVNVQCHAQRHKTVEL